MAVIAVEPAAVAAPSPSTPFEVVRPGDGSLTCEQLSAEANQLGSEMGKAPGVAAGRPAGGMDAAGASANMAGVAAMGLGSRFSGMIPLAGQALSLGLRMRAQSKAAQTASAEQQDRALRQQRLDRVTALHDSKKC